MDFIRTIMLSSAYLITLVLFLTDTSMADIDVSIFRKARVLFLSGHYRDAYDVISSATSQQKLPDWAAVTKAKILTEAGDYDTALMLFDRVRSSTLSSENAISEARRWEYYIESLTGYQTEYIRKVSPYIDYDATYFGDQYRHARCIESATAIIRIASDFSSHYSNEEYTRIVSQSLEKLRMIGYIIPLPVKVFLKPGVHRSEYIYNHLVLYPESPYFESDVFYELTHAVCGYDQWVKPGIAEAFSMFVLMSQSISLSQFVTSAEVVRKKYPSTESIVSIWPDLDRRARYDVKLLAWFYVYIISRKSEKDFWDMYYSLDDPYQAYFGMDVKHVLEDFHNWLKTRPEEKIYPPIR